MFHNHAETTSRLWRGLPASSAPTALATEYTMAWGTTRISETAL